MKRISPLCRNSILVMMTTSIIFQQSLQANPLKQYFYYRQDQMTIINNNNNIKQEGLLINHERIVTTTNNHSAYNLSDSRNIQAVYAPGQEAQTQDYLAYGRSLTTKNRFTYDGEYQDPTTQLVYLRARNYQPEAQRFISMDRYNVWNKYSFANANPISNNDPSGHLAKWAKTLLSITPIVLMAGLSWRGATHSMDYNALPHDEGALSYFVKRRGIKRIYVDIDKTLLIKKPEIEARFFYGSIDLEDAIHNKYIFGNNGKRYQAIMNESLIKQLITARDAGVDIHVLSTGGWQESPFEALMEDHGLKLDGFHNKASVKKHLWIKNTLMGKGRAFSARDTLLIDDQGHQRLSFWAQRGGYAMNPNQWW